MSRLGSCLEFERGARECEKINFETRIYPKDSENRYRSLKFNGIFLSLQRGNKLSTLELRGGRGGNTIPHYSLHIKQTNNHSIHIVFLMVAFSSAMCCVNVQYKRQMEIETIGIGVGTWYISLVKFCAERWDQILNIK